MLKTVEGVFRQGRIELNEMPGGVHDPTPVVVTFLAPRSIDLPAEGINEAQAADLRTRLATFVEDWKRPEMDVYDDYDGSRLRTR